MAYIAVITCSALWFCVAKVALFSQNAKDLLLFYHISLHFVVLNDIYTIILTFRPAKPRCRGPCYLLSEVVRQQERHH